MFLFQKRKLSLALLFLTFITSHLTRAQDISKIKFGKGLYNAVAADSSFSVKFGARFQTLYVGVQNKETREYADRFLIRRARLKFDGFAFSPKLEYKIELGLSNSDMSNGDIDQLGNTANLILDAVLKYNFYGNWTIWFGQTKLPGNIERVVSSQQLEFVDRSALNNRFNIDRDKGIQLHYEGEYFRSISCISEGEGRNVTVDNSGGYDYTQRFEYLPFGQFTKGGDYFSADLQREPKPKLLLGLTYDYNDRASRERGQLGSFMSDQRTLSTWFADVHFKYNGFSSVISYAHKSAPDGAVIARDQNDNVTESFYTGTGFNWDAGYVFKNNIQLALRYTTVTPEKVTERNIDNQYTAAISKYFVNHNLKIQSDFTLIDEDVEKFYMFRFQVELAF